MPDKLKKIVKLTQAQYDILEAGGTAGGYTGLDPNYIYHVEDTNEYVTTVGAYTLQGHITFASGLTTNHIYEDSNHVDMLWFEYSQQSGSAVYTEGHIILYGDNDDNNLNKPDNVINPGNDIDITLFNTGFYIYDNDDSVGYKISFPGKSGTFALVEDLDDYAPISHMHSAADITTGVLADARIPDLSASKITSGTFSDARIASASIWNEKYTKPSGGIPASDLAESYALSTHNHDGRYVKPTDLATVATSGNYNDLINKPTIPTVNDGMLTIQTEGTSKGTFTANQSGNSTINITKDDFVQSRTYTGLIGTTNEYKNATFYFMNVRPISWNKEWRIRYRIEAHLDDDLTPANYQNYHSIHECEIIGARGVTSAYKYFNGINNTSYRVIYYNATHCTTETGFNAGYPHLIGIELTSSSALTNVNYKRTIKITLIDYQGCEVTFNDNPLIPWQSTRTDYTKNNQTYYPQGADSNSPGYDYRGNLYTNGLIETADNDTKDMLVYYSTYLTTSSYLGLCGYSLFGFDNEGKIQAISKKNASQETQSTDLSIDRVYNEGGFDVSRGLFRWNSSGYRPVDSSAIVSIDKVNSSFNFKYSDNAVDSGDTALTMYGTKFIYLRGTIGNDGLFYLAPMEVTYNNQTYKKVWTQDIPTTEDGYVYWLVGSMNNSTTRTVNVKLFAENPLYWFKDGRFREYNPIPTVDYPVTDVTINGASVVTNKVAILGALAGKDKISSSDISSGYYLPSQYISQASVSGNTLTLTSVGGTSLTYTPTFTEQHVGDVVSVSATAGSGIAISGTTANPTVGIASNYKLPTITEWAGKQDELPSQTAYSSKGSATKVPQITTNILGQVTSIVEVTITDNDHYSSRLYSSGLKIANAVGGDSVCTLYVPNATTTQAGVLKIGTTSNDAAAGDHNHDGVYAEISDLATVATSGSYNDLTNKPTIPSSDSDLVNNRYIRYDTDSQGLTETQKANARANIGAGSSSGTVTSVTLTMPSIFSVSGSPITSSGTLAVRFVDVSAGHKVFAGPSNGTAGAPLFRALIADDIPSLDASKITSGTFADARIASANTWNLKYTKPSGGIPASDLAESYALSTHNHDNIYTRTDDLGLLAFADEINPTNIASGYYLPSTYIKSATVSGNTLTLTKEDNTTVSFSPSGGSATDVQINGTSITSGGVANIPYAGYNIAGVVSISDQEIKGLKSFLDGVYVYGAKDWWGEGDNSEYQIGLYQADTKDYSLPALTFYSKYYDADSYFTERAVRFHQEDSDYALTISAYFYSDSSGDEYYTNYYLPRSKNGNYILATLSDITNDKPIVTLKGAGSISNTTEITMTFSMDTGSSPSKLPTTLYPRRVLGLSADCSVTWSNQGSISSQNVGNITLWVDENCTTNTGYNYCQMECMCGTTMSIASATLPITYYTKFIIRLSYIAGSSRMKIKINDVKGHTPTSYTFSNIRLIYLGER